MGKVISLKLTKKEERIIAKLNQEGITNSDLLRSALWHYFSPVNQPVNGIDPVDQKVKSTAEEDNRFLYDNLYRLNKEVNLLREHNAKLQEEFSEEIARLRKHIYGDSSKSNLVKEELTPREQFVLNIHKNIDDILKNR